MRKLRRSIAHAKMKAAGLNKVNKPRKGLKGEPLPSFFAAHWREYT